MKMEIQIQYRQCHQRSKCCGDCGSKAGIFLHNVCIRSAYRHLCTSCLLRHHSGSFCPICFDFYGDHPPPPHQRLMCLRCPSISHLSCVVPPNFPSRPPRYQYQCPPCSNPNYYSPSSSRTGSSSRNNKLKSNDREPPSSQAPPTPIDKYLAVKLMAAARIASVSMNKAASVAWVEAERKVKEALLARNRANAALEHEASLVAKQDREKEKEKEKEKPKPRSKMYSKPVAEHPKLRPKLGNFVVAQKHVQNQTGTPVSGSLKKVLSVKRGSFCE